MAEACVEAIGDIAGTRWHCVIGGVSLRGVSLGGALLGGGGVAWGGSLWGVLLGRGFPTRIVGSCRLMPGTHQDGRLLSGTHQMVGSCRDDQDDQENQNPATSRILAPQQFADVIFHTSRSVEFNLTVSMI